LFFIKLKKKASSTDDDAFRMIEFKSFSEMTEPLKQEEQPDNNTYLYTLFKKINLVEKPEVNTIEIEIDAYVEKMGEK